MRILKSYELFIEQNLIGYDTKEYTDTIELFHVGDYICC